MIINYFTTTIQPTRMAETYIIPMSNKYLAQIIARTNDNKEPDKEFLSLIVFFIEQRRKNNFLSELIDAWAERGNEVMNINEAKKRVKENGFFIIRGGSGGGLYEFTT